VKQVKCLALREVENASDRRATPHQVQILGSLASLLFVHVNSLHRSYETHNYSISVSLL